MSIGAIHKLSENPPGTAQPSGQEPALLHDVMLQTAQRYPDATAIDVPCTHQPDGRTTISYRELDHLTLSLAGRLSPLISTESRVAIYLTRETHHLYIAQLAVMRAGAAYVCIDPSFPPERVEFILKDAAPDVILSQPELMADISEFRPSEAVVDVHAWYNEDRTHSVHLDTDVASDNLAYIIYTSGTTGQPKGVMIEHHSIVNLVMSDRDYFGLKPGDRIAQSSSAAYDSSIEETYLAFATGATLVVVNDEIIRMGPDLSAWLAKERISVLCPPPTLLRTMGCTDPRRQLPDLKLLYVGGEALTSDIAELWAVDRWMENGYGPTECAVTVVRGAVVPGQPITIGRPVKNNVAWILDESLNPVHEGQAGELCISGAGVARGYLNRPELTRERFIEHPRCGRIYRTGDRVRRLASGELDYLGRIDSQVKVRGYRVELASIESHIANCPGVQGAACTVQDTGVSQQLMGFIVPAEKNAPDLDLIRATLSKALPGYMVPARLSLIDELPTSTSGKIDRNALPILEGATALTSGGTPPETDDEKFIAAAFQDRLGLSEQPGVEHDFFELGGDSLLAALVISELRTRESTNRLTVRDLYETRNVRGLAQRAEAIEDNEDVPTYVPTLSDEGHPMWATLVQILGLTLGSVLMSIVGYLVFVELAPRFVGHLGLIESLICLPFAMAIVFCIYCPLSIALAVLAKRILIGRYRPGNYPAWGALYVRHWFVQRFVGLVPWGTLAGTEFMNMALRALGARIGRKVRIARGVQLLSGGWDLLEIGDGSSIGRDAALRMADLDAQHLVIGPISIGRGATLDTRAGMGPHTRLGDGGYLGPLSMLSSGQSTEANVRMVGVPAEANGPTKTAPEITSKEVQWSPVMHGLLTIASRMGMRIVGLIPMLASIAAAVIVTQVEVDSVINWVFELRLDQGTHLIGLMCALPVLLALELFFCALLVRGLGSVRPGIYGLFGPTSIRIGLKESLLEWSGRWLSGSLFWPPWLRLAGMRIGANCEISTISDAVPELTTIGEQSFFADGIYLGNPQYHHGVMECAHVELGHQTFVGNHAVIPAGSRLPDDILLGVCTVADDAIITSGSSWFGHPAFQLPNREIIECDRALTHEPNLARYLSRLFWESARLVLPCLPLLVFLGWLKLAAYFSEVYPLPVLLALVLPVLSICSASVLLFAVWASKWCLLGKVKASQHPLWSSWCSRWDFLYVAWGVWASRILKAFEGSLALNTWLRTMGVSIGRRVLLGRGFAQVVDPDMLNFEDGTTVAGLFQAHSFEDRVLKTAPVFIRENASVRSGSVLLYGANIGERTCVGEHSVVMKHERLIESRYYVGCPTSATSPLLSRSGFESRPEECDGTGETVHPGPA